MRRVGAVDIGGTKIAVGVVREDGALLDRVECQTCPERGFADALSRIEELLLRLVDRCGQIDGIGIGCPGPLDPFTGIIGDVGTLPGWNDGNLAAELGSRFGLTVAVENDADAAALAEYAWGAAQATGTLIYITVSTGIGGGLVQNGEIYRGVHGAHPEFGHQLIDPSGPLCYCGIAGCWESLASGTAMPAHLESIAPGCAPLTAEQICERARAGDANALKAVVQTGHYLGLGLANLVTLFAPDAIRLGGGVMRSSDLFLQQVQSLTARLCTQVPVQSIDISASRLGHDVGLLGAAQSWLQRNS